MANWETIHRASIFDDNNYYDIYYKDVTEHMSYRCGGSMIMKCLNSGKHRIYIPDNYYPDFDALGKELVVTVEDGETFAFDEINDVRNYTKSGVDVIRYTSKQK